MIFYFFEMIFNFSRQDLIVICKVRPSDEAGFQHRSRVRTARPDSKEMRRNFTNFAIRKRNATRNNAVALGNRDRKQALQAQITDQKMNTPNLKNFLHEDMLEAGCDEAGRGPLAGPVFAAAVILPKDFFHPLLNDSKKMTEAHREEVREVIEKEAVSWAVEQVSPEEIDELNILWASVTGMQRAVSRLEPAPDFLLIDGNKFRPFGRYGANDYLTVVKGDATYASIAAASVLAKTWRDDFMKNLAAEFPQYGWERNMGYPTPEHIAAIKKYGYTPWHRMSFHPKELEPTLF